MGGVNNPIRLKFNPINAALYPVLNGVAGYIDTDVSSTCGTNQTKLWVVNAVPSAAGWVGVRTQGIAADPKIQGVHGTFLTSVASNGHLDLYRDAAASVSYFITGYLR